MESIAPDARQLPGLLARETIYHLPRPSKYDRAFADAIFPSEAEAEAA